MLEELLDRDDFAERFLAGDKDACEILWRYGIKHFIPYYCWLGFQYVEAEDLWSETYLDLCEHKCPSYDPSRGPFRPWFRMVAKRVGLYELRQRRRAPHISLDECEDIPSPDNRNEEKESGKSELVILVERARELLNEQQRSIISQRFDEDLSIDLIAEGRRISKPAASMRVWRGLQKLRQILEGLNCCELSRRRKKPGRRNPRRATPLGSS
jgi:RNA polymerase sigma factor (sigma-70 family)